MTTSIRRRRSGTLVAGIMLTSGLIVSGTIVSAPLHAAALPALEPTTADLQSAGEFTPLPPARILDTRDGTGRNGLTSPLGAGQPVEVQVTGRGGVAPDHVVAVTLNVTVTRPTAWSYLTVWPSGDARPDSSNLNYVAGQTVANHVTVAVGDLGRVRVANQFGTAHVIFDVVGFYADVEGPAGSRYQAVDPARLFDTRSGAGGVDARPIGAGGTLSFAVLGQAGVPPAGVSAVVLNVTATRATAWSYLTVYPGDLATRPTASSLNFVPGQTVPNLVTVRVPASGEIDVFNAFGSVDVVADVVGYFHDDPVGEAGRFVPLTPFRTFDSRSDGGGPIGPDEAWLIGTFPGFAGIPPGEADSIVLNVTATQATAWSYLSVFPSHVCSLPDASNLNYVPGQTVPNQVIVRLGQADGCAAPDEVETIGVYNFDGTVHVVMDVFGFYTAATTTVTS